MLTSQRRVAALIVGLGTLTAFIVMRPDLMFTANTPTGGDMGAHVFLPAFLRDTLLPQGRIMGWAPDWYAGFPALYFYFPLPALAIVVLDLALPYGVAFKLVTAAGIIALPWAGYVFAKAMGFSRVVAALGGVAGGMYVFMESHAIWGGNIKATMAGEFSFSIAIALGLLYLAAVVEASRQGRGFTPKAGVLLALTALSHVIVVMVVVVASLPLLIRRGGVKTVVGSWTLGFAVAGAWALPLLLRLGFTTDMGWDPVKGDNPQLGFITFPDANLYPREFLPVLVLGVLGFVWALVRGRDVIPAAWLAIVPAAGYLALPVLEFTKLYNARLLPFYYYTLYLFAGLAVGMALSLWANRARRIRPGMLAAMWVAGTGAVIAITTATEWLPRASTYLPVIALILGLLVILNVGRGSVRHVALASTAPLAALAILFVGVLPTSDAPGWIRHNYTGYEGKDAFGEYIALMTTIDELPPGRVQWEANSPEMGRYGTPMALMLLPYWTEHESMEGVYFESSVSTSTHFLNTAEVSKRPSNPVRGIDYFNFNFDRAAEHLPFSGIDYYVSFTEEAKAEALQRDDFEVLAESDPFTIFAAPPSELVEIATVQPVVYDGDRKFLDRLGVGVEWYGRVDELDYWLAEDGPPEWPRIGDVPPRTVDGEPTLPSLVGVGRPIDTVGTVSDIELTDSSISFTTTAVGVPHLVKVSTFPNWKASGADGPFIAAPSFMMVVPTQEQVELNFVRTWDEWLGILLSVGGIAVAIGWSRFARRRPKGQFAA